LSRPVNYFSSLNPQRASRSAVENSQVKYVAISVDSNNQILSRNTFIVNKKNNKFYILSLLAQRPKEKGR
jgi:hypothetical protein